MSTAAARSPRHARESPIPAPAAISASLNRKAGTPGQARRIALPISTTSKPRGITRSDPTTVLWAGPRAAGGFGQFLPRAYWASQYILADYWLFALEVPPAGYEWVRVGTDAFLVNIATGEILQAEYGVFA